MIKLPKYFNLSLEEIEKNIKILDSKIDEEWNKPHDSYEEYISATKEFYDEMSEYTASKYLKTPRENIKFHDWDDFYEDCKVTVEDFKKWCDLGYVTSDDGYGEYADDEGVSNLPASTRHFKRGYIRDDFKYVCWYNK